MHVAMPDDLARAVEAGSGPRDDVAFSVYLALARLAAVVAAQCVKIDVAVRPGLQVRMRPAALADILEELLAAALQAAPASRMLITAAANGDCVQINIIDDMPGGDLVVRLNRIRMLSDRVAMRGDSLVIDVRPDEGTMMTLRVAGEAHAVKAAQAV
jgi:signal transduction histidine kinase